MKTKYFTVNIVIIRNLTNLVVTWIVKKRFLYSFRIGRILRFCVKWNTKTITKQLKLKGKVENTIANLHYINGFDTCLKKI